MRYDVMVLGAGVSGLACGNRLREAGLTVGVLEARDRIGGRVHTFRPADGGPPVELGAQVIHGEQNPVREKLDEPAVRPRDSATAFVRLDGKVRPMAELAQDGRPPWLLDEALLATGGGFGDRSVRHWLDSLSLKENEHRVAIEWYRQTWSTAPEQLSAAGTARAWHGDRARGGTGEYVVADGFAALTDHLADGLDVHLDQPVSTVDWDRGRVTVHAGDEAQTANAVVVTVPPALVAAGRPRIAHLSPSKQAAAAMLAPGDGCCAVATLSEPAPSAAVVFDADGDGGFVSCRAGRPEVLVVAKAGAAGRLRRALAANTLPALLAAALPWVADTDVEAVDVADWGRDPWAGGSFSFPRAGAMWAPAMWAQPMDGTVFFAGESTVVDRCSPFVHGAFDSGVRAAEQVLEALS